jgi:CRP/FNR family transcriptional regulator, cyclic AMP receptor protein
MTERYAPFDLFQWLSDDARAAFLQEARKNRFPIGALIYTEGERGSHMYRIVRGTVRLSVARANGREVIYRFFEPGDCFGISACIDQEPYPQTAEAGDDVEVQVINQASFNRLRVGDRSFEDALLRLMTRQMRLLSVFTAESHLDDLTARVASRILTATQSFGQPDKIGIRLKVHLSQADLALQVGTSRQSVNKILHQLQEDGVLLIEYASLVITDIGKIQRLATKP